MIRNHWHAEDVGVAAFVPVDGEHTLLYLRFYQRFLRLPLLGGLVAHQDRRVVRTQRPKPSALRGDEQLVQGDRPRRGIPPTAGGVNESVRASQWPAKPSARLSFCLH